MYLFVGLTEILRPKTKQSKAEWETATRNLWKRIKFEGDCRSACLQVSHSQRQSDILYLICRLVLWQCKGSKVNEMKITVLPKNIMTSSGPCSISTFNGNAARKGFSESLTLMIAITQNIPFLRLKENINLPQRTTDIYISPSILRQLHIPNGSDREKTKLFQRRRPDLIEPTRFSVWWNFFFFRQSISPLQALLT